MDDIVKISTYTGILFSKDNIITEVSKAFLELTGYNEEEILGKTLVEVCKILRIDSQIDLEDIKVDSKIFLFTKDLVAIEGTISCKIIDDGFQKIYSFKEQYYNLAKEKY